MLLSREDADDALQVLPWSRMVASAFGVLDNKTTFARALFCLPGKRSDYKAVGQLPEVGQELLSFEHPSVVPKHKQPVIVES